MAGIVALLSGRKSYLTAVVMVAYALYGLVYGHEPTFGDPGGTVDSAESFRLLFEGLGLSTLRAAIAKVR